jgi:hypothetical protein
MANTASLNPTTGPSLGACEFSGMDQRTNAAGDENPAFFDQQRGIALGMRSMLN